MDIAKLIDRVRKLLLTPMAEWPVVAGETATKQQIYVGYVLPLAGVAAVCTFLSSAVIGSRVPFIGTVRVGFGFSLTVALLSLLMSVVSVFVVALVINALAPSFGGQKDDVQSTKTAAYCYTAMWVASIPALLPFIGMLIALAGAVYGIYQLYLGLQFCMKAPVEKAVGYTVVTVLVAIVVSFVFGAVTSSVVGMGMTGSSLGSMMGRGALGNSASVTVDADSAAGQMEKWAAGVEAAGKKADAADKAGNPAAAAAAAAGVLGAVLGGGADGKPVETLSIDAMKALLPAASGGFDRRDVSAERNAMGGFKVSVGRARYGDGNARDVELEVTDFGGAAGLMAMAGLAASIDSEKETETGYEKTYRDGDRIVHEEWNRRDNRGEYTLLTGKRYAIKASGKAGSIADLKSLATAVDLPKVQ